ncbi:hypothetical protein HanRHA438_Chr15g0698111 [Helianthus annuus]|nr:hypothetical protein HanRHA438_Chr15g0698111 [Helianthus annuus]
MISSILNDFEQTSCFMRTIWRSSLLNVGVWKPVMAVCKNVSPVLFLVCTDDGDALTKKSTTEMWPLQAATCSGVLPCLSVEFMISYVETRYLTTCIL